MKILKFFRNFLVLFFCGLLFIFFTEAIINLIWSFNYLSLESWEILSQFWNKGGIIHSMSDFFLLFSLFSLPILLFFACKYALRLNYWNIFSYPLKLIINLLGIDSVSDPERILLKNQKSSKQIIEELKNKIDSAKPEKSKEAHNIRSEISKKIAEEIKSL